MGSPYDINLDYYNLPAAGSTPIYTQYDYTSAAVAASYQQNIQVLYNLFQETNTANTNGNVPATSPYTQADADSASTALNNLLTLAENGIGASQDPTALKTSYLTVPMAQSLDLLIKSFQAAGATNPTSSISLDALNQWKNLSLTDPTIENNLTAAFNAVSGNTSLQALLELDYVATGNVQVSTQLQSMQTALSLTNEVLSSLGTLQNIHNQLVVINPSSLNFNYASNNGSDSTYANYDSAYVKAASSHFTTAVLPTVPSALLVYGPSSSQYLRNPIGITASGKGVLENLLLVRQSLNNFIPQLSAQLSALSLADPNSLYGRVKAVLHDFSILLTGPSNIQITSTSSDADKTVALYKWLMDRNDPRTAYNPDGLPAGNAQQDITLGITAGQSLNDQQKQSVQQFIFIFQQFYQSASSMLQSLTQIIEKMAQNISR